MWPLYSETAYTRSLAEDDLATHTLSEALRALEAGDTRAAAEALVATLGHFQRATDAARAFRAMSSRIVAARQLGDVLRRQGRLVARFGRMLPGKPEPAPFFEAALAEYRAGLALPESAAELAEEARALDRRQQMRRHVHDLLVELGRPEEAVAVAREAYAAQPDDDEDALRLLDLLMHALDLRDEAAAVADQVVADQPVSPVRLALAAQAHFLAGHDARAADLTARLRRLLDLRADPKLEAALWEPLAAMRDRLTSRPGASEW
jgi:hypothetical protein